MLSISYTPPYTLLDILSVYSANNMYRLLNEYSVLGHSFACSRSDIEVANRPMLDICVTSQSCNKRACNKRLYGTIASHDEVWTFYRDI